MGKIKVVTKEEDKGDAIEQKVESTPKQTGKAPKKKVVVGILNIEATFNNTKVVLTDKEGGVLFWTSAGSLGFKGAKRVHLLLPQKLGL